VLMAGHTFEYNAAVCKLHQLIRDGELGEICYIDTARLNLGLYQQDVNVIWDLAPHDISILNLLLGRRPVSISAWGDTHVTDALEDVAYLQLRYAEPSLSAYIHVSWLDPCKVRRVTVVGTEKMAVYDDLSHTERIRIYDVGVTPASDGGAMHAVPMSYRYGDIVSPYIPFEEPLALQDAHFIHCIREGTGPRTDGVSGMAVVRVLEAATQALRLGREVELLPYDVPRPAAAPGPEPRAPERRSYARAGADS
jgi:predicted dehydrogenase